VARITIRRLDDKVKARLRVRAAEHGRSMEEEARAILKSALEPEENLWQAIRKHVEPFGGFEIELPPRGPVRPPPDF
jgi:plasmid stability protein